MIVKDKPVIMWAWVCGVTGMVWDMSWGATKDYAIMRTQKTLGKRRMEMGEVRPVRVTVTLLTDADAAAHQAEYEVWKAEKEARNSKSTKGTS